MTELTIITNNVPRNILDAYELTTQEREQFDYIKWGDIATGDESASFFRYKGELYDLGEFIYTSIGKWDGFMSDSFFSGILIRYANNYEQVIVARCYS